MRIEAENLQQAYTLASQKLNCSVTELDIKIIQHPSGGFLGLFKKSAIIEARKEGEYNADNQASVKEEIAQNDKQIRSEKRAEKFAKPEKKIVEKPNEIKKRQKVTTQKPPIDDKILSEIKEGLEALFGVSSFEISVVEVSKFDEDNVYIKLDGRDAPLLIGKEGRRYRSLSYMLYNWINQKYGVSICLEISEFLKAQIENFQGYLSGVIEKAKAEGKAHTKPVDGILVKIALDRLKAEMPDKYIALKSGKNGKFIVINEKR